MNVNLNVRLSMCTFLLVMFMLVFTALFLPLGLVADCGLTDSLPTSCAPHATDNDGLWTSIALAAEAFRYQVTGEESARDNAWSLFQGMQFLNNVSVESGV